jgi:protein-S-isoprenylcysteine O-methyltransferase Ste14
VVILFLLIGIWAMMVMKFNFNISPELIEGTNLKTSGPYGFIRHPMYLSVLGITFSWLLNEWSYFRLIIWLILFIDLILKINFEEKLLNKAFKDFKIYKSKTKKLIPFVF